MRRTCERTHYWWKHAVELSLLSRNISNDRDVRPPHTEVLLAFFWICLFNLGMDLFRIQGVFGIKCTQDDANKEYELWLGPPFALASSWFTLSISFFLMADPIDKSRCQLYCYTRTSVFYSAWKTRSFTATYTEPRCKSVSIGVICCVPSDSPDLGLLFICFLSPLFFDCRFA